MVTAALLKGVGMKDPRHLLNAVGHKQSWHVERLADEQMHAAVMHRWYARERIPRLDLSRERAS